MLDANQDIGGNNTGVTPADLKTTADFYYQRTFEINTELVKLRRKQTDQQDLVNRLNAQLYESNARTTPPSGEITVLVIAGGNIRFETDVTLRYVVSDCGWAPSYDLLADNVGSPVNLKYRAKVFNNTNVDWKNVTMKLSTANPMQSAAAPQLEKWTLDFDQGYSNYNNNGSYYGGGNAPAAYDGSPQTLSNENLASQAPAQPQAVPQGGNQNYGKATWQQPQQTQQQPQQYEQIQVSELAAEFDIKLKYDVPADGKPYIVDVTEYTLNATYKYFCVPKMEREAFLLARITGWEDLDLVEGPANVYFGGTYVGQSYINTRSVDDTLDLSFGRDKSLIVTRTKLKEFNNE